MIKNFNENKMNLVRNENYDFTDDGTRFLGYDFKAENGIKVPVTKATSCGEKYICFRPDYFKKDGFCYSFWYDNKGDETWEARDEFNGCTEIDENKFIENGNLVAKSIVNSIDEFKKLSFDKSVVIASLKESVADRKARLEKVKTFSFEDFTSEWDFKRSFSDWKDAKRDVENLEKRLAIYENEEISKVDLYWAIKHCDNGKTFGSTYALENLEKINKK